MRFTNRPFMNEEDYWRARVFLREVFLLNHRREVCWQPYRLDYWRWHLLRNCRETDVQGKLWLWEDEAGRIVAVMHSESTHDAWLEVHPEYRTPQLEEEMIEVAIREFAEPRPDGRKLLCFWVEETDSLRQELMLKYGYERYDEVGYKRYCDLTQPLQPLPLPPGYTIRSLGDESELPARSWASWTAFHPDEPDSVYEGWEWYHNIQCAPLYRRDLDIVAIAPDGSVASFCTVWFDDHTRTAGFDPVGTDKHHQRRGLARAVMREGQIRAQAMGATLGTIGSWDEITHNLYASMGFVQPDIGRVWFKRW